MRPSTGSPGPARRRRSCSRPSTSPRCPSRCCCGWPASDGSAIALCADSSAVTAIGNDYGFEELFARQVRAHGRAGDILIALSTSGRSPNLLAAVRAAQEAGLRTWALTGPAPNPLADLCHDAVVCPSPDSQVVQELHLVSVHVLCEHVDRFLPGVLDPRSTHRPAQRPRGPRPDLVLAAMPAVVTPGNGPSGNGYRSNGHGSAS